MSDYSFPTFVRKYKDGSLQEDLTYRAYNLEDAATEGRTVLALKQLHFRPSVELSVKLDAVTAAFGIRNTAQVLAMWYLWNKINNGVPVRVKLRENQHGDA